MLYLPSQHRSLFFPFFLAQVAFEHREGTAQQDGRANSRIAGRRMLGGNGEAGTHLRLLLTLVFGESGTIPHVYAPASTMHIEHSSSPVLSR